MEQVFFHPERNRLDDSPVFTNYYQYRAIIYFLEISETIEPELIRDLESIIPLYINTEEIHNKIGTGYLDGWNVFEQANESNNKHLLELKNEIINWAKKYNLVDDKLTSSIYLAVALWAIPSKIEHPETMAQRKEFLYKIGREDPNFYNQNWSITDSIYHEDEEDVKKIEDIDFYTGKEFPVIFTPDFSNLNDCYIIEVEETAGLYENILSDYYEDVSLALNGKKDEIRGYKNGYSWDPRTETWSEFENKLDKNFYKYKELYKKRTEEYLKKYGYIKGKEKRNKEHFHWLVRYQIQGWSIKKIADYYSKDKKILTEDTVKKGLVNTASMVDIYLRKN